MDTMLDPVTAISSCYRQRRVLWDLRPEHTPKECTVAAQELRKLADALRHSQRYPALREPLLMLSRSCRTFTTAGDHCRSYEADPDYFLAQREILKSACESVIWTLRNPGTPSASDGDSAPDHDWTAEIAEAQRESARNKALIEAGETFRAHKPLEYKRGRSPSSRRGVVN